MLAAIGIRDQHFATIFQPANRIIDLHSEPAETNLFRGKDGFVAKAATHIGRDDSDLCFGDLQAFRKPGPHHMGELRRAVDNKLGQSCVPMGNKASALNRRHDLTRGAKFTADAHGRGLGHRFNVTIIPNREENIVVPIVVQQRRIRLDRFNHIDNGRQLFIFDHNFGSDVLGFRAGVGNAYRNKLTHLANLAGR